MHPYAHNSASNNGPISNSGMDCMCSMEITNVMPISNIPIPAYHRFIFEPNNGNSKFVGIAQRRFILRLQEGSPSSHMV